MSLNFWKATTFSLLSALLLIPVSVSASNCPAFKDAIQTHSGGVAGIPNTSHINLACGAQVYNSPTNFLASRTLATGGSHCNTCSGEQCQSSGVSTNLVQAGNFQHTTVSTLYPVTICAQSDTDSACTIRTSEMNLSQLCQNAEGSCQIGDIRIRPGARAKFTGDIANYHIKSLTIDPQDTIHSWELLSGGLYSWRKPVIEFTGANYWIESMNIGQYAIVQPANLGTTRIYTKENLMIADNTHINSPVFTTNQKDQNLLLYSFSDIVVGSTPISTHNDDDLAGNDDDDDDDAEGSVFSWNHWVRPTRLNGLLYAKGNIHIFSNVEVSGAVTGLNVTVENGSAVTYNPLASGGADLASLNCTVQQLSPSCPTFANAVQTHNGTDKTKHIFQKCDARIVNPSNPFLFSNTYLFAHSDGNAPDCDEDSLGCSNANCTSIGSSVHPLSFADAPEINSNAIEQLGLLSTVIGHSCNPLANQCALKKVILKRGRTYSFSPNFESFAIEELVVEKNVTLLAYPRTYWIQKWIPDENFKLKVIGNDTARFLVKDNLEFKSGTMMNTPLLILNASPSKLIIATANNMRIHSNSAIQGALYAKDTIEIHDNSSIQGAVTGGEVKMGDGTGNNVVVSYDAEAMSNLNIADMCHVEPTKFAYFKVVHSTQGLNCRKEPVDIYAMNSDGSINTSYTGKIRLDTRTAAGDWLLKSGAGALNALSDAGVAEYQFHADDNGHATFELDYRRGPTPVNIRVEDRQARITDDDSEGLLNFAPSGLVLSATKPYQGSASPFSATQKAGEDFTHPIYLTAVGTNSDNWQCDVIETYHGNKSIQFWAEYVDPTSGTHTLSLKGHDISRNQDVPTLVNVNFVHGRAKIDPDELRYSDVGALRLHAQGERADYVVMPLTINVENTAVSGSAVTTTEPVIHYDLAGSTSRFVVKPYDLKIQPIAHNPSTTDASGEIFAEAGENFSVNVVPVNKQGNLTPNFGLETHPESIGLRVADLIAPARGTIGELALDQAFTRTENGFRSDGVRYQDVGSIQIEAKVLDGNYLGVGSIYGTPSETIGRFAPSELRVTMNNPVLESQCANFTYVGQNFGYLIPPQVTVTALNRQGHVTSNYTGDFWKVDLADIHPVYTAFPSVPAFDSSSASMTFRDLRNGSGVYTFNEGLGFSFMRQLPAPSPFTANIALAMDFVDTDGVRYPYNPVRFGNARANEGMLFAGSNEMRFGRMILKNNAGPEITDMKLQTVTEYFDGSHFVTNKDDYCTPLTDQLQVVFQDPKPSNLLTTANFLGPPSDPLSDYFIRGARYVNLAPTQQAGYVDVEIDLHGAGLPWLTFDWGWDNDGLDGNLDDNPRARANFGTAPGSNSPVLSTFERFN